MTKRKVIAFDLDGTLAASKYPMDDRMGELLGRLFDKYQVCIMSGGSFEQFEKQLLPNLKANANKLKKLHLMPTCGTRYYRFKDGRWHQEYAEEKIKKRRKKLSRSE